MNEHVLIVDDDEPIRRLVTRILVHQGYTCHTAEDAEGARRHMAAGPVDLLISDIMMPGESGIELVRFAAREYPHMALLMLTGVHQPESAAAAIGLGVDGYVTKPFEKNQLLVSVHLALQHRELEMERRQHREELEKRVQQRTRELQQTVAHLETTRQELQKATSLFQGLFAKARVGIAICAPGPDGEDLVFVDVNPAAEHLDGRRRDSLIHRPVREVFPATIRLGLLDWAHKVARTGRPEHHLVTIPMKDRTVWRDYYIYRLPTGEVATFYTDETERIEAEFKLRGQYRFIQNLMESIPNPIFYKGRDGRYLGCNSAFAALFDRSREALVGLSPADLAPADLAAAYMEVDRELLVRGGARQIETQIQTAEGVRRDILLNKTSYSDDEGHIAGVVGVVVDISARKQAEAVLKESEAEFRAIAECAQDAIVRIDGQGIVTYWNHAAETIFGYTAEEIVGRPLHPLVAPPEHLDRIGKSLERFRETGAGPGIGKVMEVTAQHKSGRAFPAELSIAGVRLKGAWHAIGIVRDITARKQMEERLLGKNRTLAAIRADLEARNRRLSAMHDELQRAQQQTLQQEKMASIGQLAAGVAHEINNPTGFVSSNLKSLEDYLEEFFGLLQGYRDLRQGLGGAVDASVAQRLAALARRESEIDLDFLMADTRDLIRESREGTERIKKIVIDLKDFAHPGQHERVPADINRNLDSVLNIVWNEVKYKATVHKDYGDLPPVECYPQQLNQVFMNLLVNAGQAMERQGDIYIVTRAVDGGVEVRIRDTGCGIPAEHLPRVFDPFFTTKPVGKGTGLGLNVAYNIVRKHGGQIAVDSRVGEGTTFTVRLPLPPDGGSPRGLEAEATAGGASHAGAI